ncbi:hypothetical protein ABW20_dc0110559 [Dactylellina cionopaga]|nr:hypothetical protein ABW20_dc0110559 [Dactylellina cionopaga]
MEDVLPKQNLTRPLDAEELLDLLSQTEEKLLYNMEDPKPLLAQGIQQDYTSEDATGEAMAPTPVSEWTAEELTIPKKYRRKLSVSNSKANTPTEVAEDMQPDTQLGQNQSYKPPQTAKTTPLLTPPERETKYLRRPASFDSLKPDRDFDKVLIPPDVVDKTGVGFLFPEPAFPKQRSHSASGSRPPPNVSSIVTNPYDLHAAPREVVSDKKDLVQSPESYDLMNAYQSVRSGMETPGPSDPSPKSEPPSLSNISIPVVDVFDMEEEADEPLNNTERAFAERGSSIRIVTTSKNIRAYRLISSVDVKLIEGTLVWVDESDSLAKRFEDGVSSIKVQHFAGGPLTWVPKSKLKQGRYYAMKDKHRIEEKNEVPVKLMRNDIVVPLEDELEGNASGAQFRVVPLDEKYSVPVEREWLTEVNLAFQMA